MAFSTSLKASALASIAAMGAFALATGSPALADHHGKKAEMSQANIVETAMGTGMHETLVAAVKAAGLVDTLAAPGPYTVFAPTDDAFAALPAGTVDTLLQPENKGQLTSILTYHVVAGRVPAAALTQAIRGAGGSYEFATVAGETLSARFDMLMHGGGERGGEGVAFHYAKLSSGAEAEAEAMAEHLDASGDRTDRNASVTHDAVVGAVDDDPEMNDRDGLGGAVAELGPDP